jgi:hypothetical protein
MQTVLEKKDKSLILCQRFVNKYCHFGNTPEEALNAYLNQLGRYVNNLTTHSADIGYMQSVCEKLILMADYDFCKDFKNLLLRLRQVLDRVPDSRPSIDYCISMIVASWRVLSTNSGCRQLFNTF